MANRNIDVVESFSEDEIRAGFQEVLDDIINKDFLRQRRIMFGHPKRNILYFHEYMESEHGGVRIIRVANRRMIEKPVNDYEVRLGVEYPYLYVVIDMCHEKPVFMIEKCDEVPTSIKEVTQVLEYSLNIIMRGYGWEMKMKPSDSEEYSLSQWLKQVMTQYEGLPRTMDKLYGVETFAQLLDLLQNKALKNTSEFRRAIILEDYADEILDMLHKLVKGKKKPKDILKPFRAAMIAEMLGPFTKIAFKDEFGDILGNSISAVYKYTTKDCHSYDNDPLLGKMVKMFSMVGKR